MYFFVKKYSGVVILDIFGPVRVLVVEDWKKKVVAPLSVSLASNNGNNLLTFLKRNVFLG